MITATDKNTKVTCNTCKKSTFTVEGARSKRKAYTKAIDLGWRWKNAGTQTCPTCRKVTDKSTVAKTGKVAKPASITKKGIASKITKSGAKVTFGRKVVKASKSSGDNGSFGQSIGKLAKTAKVGSAPAAE